MCSSSISEDEEDFDQNNMSKQVPEHNIGNDVNTEKNLGSANNSKNLKTKKLPKTLGIFL